MGRNNYLGDDMKIEKGCLAVIVNSNVAKNIGKSVTVLTFIGEVNGFEGCDRWEVDGAMFTTKGGTANHQREIYLMRIDGYKEIQNIKEAELTK